MVKEITAHLVRECPFHKYALEETSYGRRSFLCCDYVMEALGCLPDTITIFVSVEEQDGWETLFTDGDRGVFNENAEEINVYSAVSEFLHENVGPCKQFWWRISK